MRGSDELFAELIPDGPLQHAPKARQEIIKIYDKETGKFYGEATAQHLKILSEHHPEPLAARSRYYLDKRTVEMLESINTDATLVDLLRSILGDKESVEITFDNSEPYIHQDPC
jgi:hypothetical protein